MLHILLADANTDNLNNIRNFIKGSFADIKVSGALSDTTKPFIKAISTTKPDLVLADIRFFGPAGIGVIKDVHDYYPDVRFILYGSHADSDYMNLARDFGVLDFMYRPIKPTDLSRCLHASITHFRRVETERREAEAIEAGFRDMQPVYRNIFLSNLLLGNIENEREIGYSFSHFGISLGEVIGVLVIRVDHFREYALSSDEKEKQMLSYKMALIASEKSASYKCHTAISSFNSVNVLISGTPDQMNLERLINLCEGIKDDITMRVKMPVTIGIGKTTDRISEISVSYRQALGALRYRIHMGYNSVIPIHFVEPDNVITYVYPYEKENILTYTATIGEYELCERLINEIFDSLRRCGELPEFFISKLITNIIISISRYLSEQNITLSAKFTEIFPSRSALELKDIDAAYAFLTQSIGQFCEYMVAYREEVDLKRLNDAKKYISEHYFESFSLQKIAYNVKTTPELINHLFTSKERRTLFEYTMDYRLSEAKRLIREQDTPDDIVAIKVGYDDVRHFRSVFKQHVGVTTDDYRAQLAAFEKAKYM